MRVGKRKKNKNRTITAGKEKVSKAKRKELY
jgi:hypothetical protein